LEEYLKIVPSLTINEETTLLKKNLDELKKSAEDNSYILKAKLEEKNSQIASLSQRLNELELLTDGFTDFIKKAKDTGYWIIEK
jgi:flagellar motility protein MotE (MotC chaperone)